MRRLAPTVAAVLICVIFGFLRFVSNREMGCLDIRKLLKGWLRGVDLNHRPLGYEFDTLFGMGILGPSSQQDTSSTLWLVLSVPGSPVSNFVSTLLCISGPEGSLASPEAVQIQPPSSARIHHDFATRGTFVPIGNPVPFEKMAVILC
jgi:hypothetical protein